MCGFLEAQDKPFSSEVQERKLSTSSPK